MRRSLTFVVGAALAVGALAGCTSEGPDDQPPKTSSPSKHTHTGTIEPSDQSALVLEETKPPTVKAKAEGKINDSSGRSFPGTLNVAEVLATTTSTRLTFWFTGSDESLSDNGSRAWEYLPALVDTTGKQIYDPVIYAKDKTAYCVCSDRAPIRADPRPRTALYPPLPESVTSIVVRKTGFPDITVPVTRQYRMQRPH